MVRNVQFITMSAVSQLKLSSFTIDITTISYLSSSCLFVYFIFVLFSELFSFYFHFHISFFSFTLNEIENTFIEVIYNIIAYADNIFRFVFGKIDGSQNEHVIYCMKYLMLVSFCFGLFWFIFVLMNKCFL